MFQSIRSLLFLSLISLILPVDANAAPVTVVARAAMPNATTNGMAMVYVQLLGLDGNPKIDAASPVYWTVRTLSVPDAFSALCTIQQVGLQTQTGQLQARTVTAVDAASGIYSIALFPGHPCGGQVPLHWAVGEYHFLITYTKGSDRGAALADLSVR